jgi:hypothetical protein
MMYSALRHKRTALLRREGRDELENDIEFYKGPKIPTAQEPLRRDSSICKTIAKEQMRY